MNPAGAEPNCERKLKAVIAYDGRAYVGWERQRNGLAVQEVLEEALAQLCQQPVLIDGSGRTDAGVHARGQVASFCFPKAIPLDKLRLALNGMTPPDIAVQSIEEVAADFHARFSAVSKRYRYSILNDSVPQPFLRHTCFHYPGPLDVDAMQAAARLFEGTHDFRAFAREADKKSDCVRTILACAVTKAESLLHLDVTGTGFLYNMVRILTGTLIEVGRGRRTAATIETLLSDGNRKQAGFTVPAHGLSLMEVHYAAPGTA